MHAWSVVGGMNASESAVRRNRRSLRRESLLLISVGMVILDQWSKHWARSALIIGRPVPFIPGFLQFRLVHNTGAAFSLFTDSTLFLGVLSLLVTLGVTAWIWSQPKRCFWMGLALAFLLGGTLGNGIDRWRLGHVTDFLELVPIQFPIFNWADVVINFAVVCFAVDAFRERHGQADS